MAKVTVTAKCVTCGKTKEIGAGDIKSGDHPMCDACGMPMVATRAKGKIVTNVVVEE